MKIDNLEGREALYGFAAFWAMILVTAAAVYFATKNGAGAQIHVQPSPVINNIPVAPQPNVSVTTPVKIERIETERAAALPDIKLYAVMPQPRGDAVVREVPVPMVPSTPPPAVPKGEVISPIPEIDPNEDELGKLLPPPKGVKKP
jgi:hypothetical protein